MLKFCRVDIYVLPPIASSSLLSFDVNLGPIPLGAKPPKGGSRVSRLDLKHLGHLTKRVCPIFSDKGPTILLVKSL
ncbi:MAG: hypothetical protein CM15mP111_2740 [Hyphomicrobiales bacterium]|nr:MAG: hypothetical protein CM15mP111_2740 [Hyphomicrobiales bacterium]